MFEGGIGVPIWQAALAALILFVAANLIGYSMIAGPWRRARQERAARLAQAEAEIAATHARIQTYAAAFRQADESDD